MPELLAGKTALILGLANKWSLAYAIAQAFHREGAKLLLTYQGERQKETVEELGSGVGAAAIFECDVTRDEDLARLAETVRQHGRLDTLVHSIAFANREDLTRPFLETSRAGYLLAQDVSAYSLVSAARTVAPLMTEGGSVITLSYLGATRVVGNYNVMGVAKASLEACVRYLSSDLGPSNIRVNAISAGAVKTASSRAVAGLSKMLEAIPTRAPLRRNCTPEEVADTAVFLASDLGRGVTGNVVFVDAGYQVMGF
ncbi:MAG: Enoyl-[acyl-carrier-protein] reductase [Bryobacterales bacterium]|nr:Enoyl-[acyl-carrier-protein] reductase [Bryobacterales bacterium]